VRALSDVRGSAPNPRFWPLEANSGESQCLRTFEPAFLDGSPLEEAKAIVYVITGNPDYAADVKKHLLQLTQTSGYGGQKWTQCIPNLSWYIPGWIIAADLIEGYLGWTFRDREQFQHWLAQEVYPKTDWASDIRSNNHGAAGSATCAMIADYLASSNVTLRDRAGNSISAHDAFVKAKSRQIDRINGNAYMQHEPGCSPAETMQGIRPDGGIPWELARGSAGCSGKWLKEKDKSWT